jgi:hypothetical protein
VNDFVVKATALCLREFPTSTPRTRVIASSVECAVNIGVAVAVKAACQPSSAKKRIGSRFARSRRN